MSKIENSGGTYITLSVDFYRVLTHRGQFCADINTDIPNAIFDRQSSGCSRGY